jgi:hypothetical protein
MEAATGWTVQRSNPGKNKGFCSLFKRAARRQSLLFDGYDGAFLGLKRLEHEFDLSPSSSAEVTNECSYTSAPFICLHGVDRKDLTFTF